MKKKHAFPSLTIEIPTLNEDDFVNQLTTHTGSTLLLGMFSVDELKAVLERARIFPALREQGLDEFIIQINPFENFDQLLTIYSGKKDKEHLLAEVRLKEGKLSQTEKNRSFPGFPPSHILSIEWMMMQNPFKPFPMDRKALPGQEHPGLGQARKVLKLIITYCRLKSIDGVVNYPEYFHNAYLYRHVFKFINPEKEAEFYALLRDLSHLPLIDMSWAVDYGCIIDARTGKTFDWFSDVQIFPLKKPLIRYFKSEEYTQQFESSLAAHKYIFDENKYINLREQKKSDK
ncbi:MAG: hypothetical protein H6696_05800 [Deferribacteres bacterium]|nr:hypothetical protein [candidate division KSB1 bacterium]MCB9501430.1 hypothetical protein [Deferribacteres bacterium]